MKSITNEILTDRENRKNRILDHLKKYPTVVSLKANIPGSNKQIKEAYLLIRIYNKLVDLPIKEKIYHDSKDGPYYLYLIDEENYSNIKEKAMEIEEGTSLGRLIDLDVYSIKKPDVSRDEMRKCLLCNNPAFVCGKLNKHSTFELINRIQGLVKNYFNDLMEKYIDESILAELNLEPKFGLVTPKSNGSHPDMNYELMIEAKNAIIPYLLLMFHEGYENDDLDVIFQNARELGKRAEKEMLIATNGINAYKGLIFNLGLVITGVGYCLSHQLEINKVFNVVQYMTRGISLELEGNLTSFGIKAYQEHQFGGARREAELGFPTVQNVLTTIDISSKKGLTSTLIDIIKQCEDTVLLKRSKTLDNYFKYKELISSIDRYDPIVIEAITKKCIKEKVSFGGSADLLIVTIFLKKIILFFD